MSSLKDHDDYLAKLEQIQDADAARLDAFRQADQDRRALFEEVITNYKNLTDAHDGLTSEIQVAKYTNQALINDNKALKAELDTVKNEQDSNSLVGVFIDGDGAKFHEKLIKNGVEGGELAAQSIKVVIKKQLKDIYQGINTDNWQIIVWYITAMDGLSSVYQASLSDKMDYSGVNFKDALRRFAIGINRGADYNFNFIDVGGGKGLKLKEITDAKLRETFKMMLPHCRHVFFAGCHDEGYVTFLSPYKHNQHIASKITLIETHGTRPKYHELGFDMTRFPEIFRTEDFSPFPTSRLQTSPPFVTEQPNRPSGVVSPTSAFENRAPTAVMSPAGGVSWASSARNGLTPSSRTINITPAKRASDGVAKKYYMVNSQNERVDETLLRTTSQMWDQFNARVENENGGKKFCNQCNFVGPEACDQSAEYFRHGRVALSPGEALVLKHVVRGVLCSEGSWCKDVDCPYGHHCKFGLMCTKEGTCRFASTHHVNTNPSRKIFADGTSQLV